MTSTVNVVGSDGNTYNVVLYNADVVVSENFLVGAAFTPTFYDAIRERVGVSITDSALGVFLETNNALFSFLTNPNQFGGKSYFLSLLDKTIPSTTFNLSNSFTVQETLGAYGNIVTGALLHYLLSDSLKLSAIQMSSWLISLTSSVRLTPQLLSIVPSIISEQLKAHSILDNIGTFDESKVEKIGLYGSVLVSIILVLQEHLTVSASIADNKALLLKIIDTLVSSGIADSRLTATQVLASAIAIHAAISAAKGASVQEAITLHSVLNQIRGFSLSLLDAVTILSSPTPSLVVSVTISDATKIIDPASASGGFDPTQFLGLLINEQLSFKIGYNANNGIWTGWAMNTQVGAVTQYEGWDFNSFTTLGNTDLAASGTGLYALGGLTDASAPINALVTVATSNLGDSRLKRVQYAYLGIDASGQLFFITNTDDGIQRVYSLVQNAPSMSTERVTMAKGVTSCYWNFSLQNVAGADFRLDSLEVIPVFLTRRV